MTFGVFRCVWLLIFLVASILLAYLVGIKLTYLLSYPKNVNVDFNFNSSLPFPAVTICNESPYRYNYVYNCFSNVSHVVQNSLKLHNILYLCTFMLRGIA